MLKKQKTKLMVGLYYSCYSVYYFRFCIIFIIRNSLRYSFSGRFISILFLFSACNGISSYFLLSISQALADLDRANSVAAGDCDSNPDTYHNLLITESYIFNHFRQILLKQNGLRICII